MTKAIYKPTNTQVIILEQIDTKYVKVFLDAQDQVLLRTDLEIQEEKNSLLQQLFSPTVMAISAVKKKSVFAGTSIKNY